MTTITIPADKLVGADAYDISREGLAEVRFHLWQWQRKQFPDRHGADLVEDLRLGIVEELGELAHAILKRRQGIRGMKDDAAFLSKRDDAIGDVLVYLSNLLSATGDGDWSASEASLNGAPESASGALWSFGFKGFRSLFTDFDGAVEVLAKVAKVRDTHVLLCFAETARKVMERTDRTETRDPV